MPVKYSQGKIYTIVNDVNKAVYVGSTAQPRLSDRMAQHRRNADKITRTSPLYNAMRVIGVDHFAIVLHHVFPCQSKDELVAEEYRTMDAIIATGQQVHNALIQGKHNQESREKMSKAHTGKTLSDENKQKIRESLFNFGSLTLQPRKNSPPCWIFQYHDAAGKRHGRSFAVKKYGNYGALFRAEEARRAIYPEWGNDEDIYCDDLGHIEWD